MRNRSETFVFISLRWLPASSDYIFTVGYNNLAHPIRNSSYASSLQSRLTRLVICHFGLNTFDLGQVNQPLIPAVDISREPPLSNQRLELLTSAGLYLASQQASVPRIYLFLFGFANPAMDNSNYTNPYAATIVEQPVNAAPVLGGMNGLWRQGKLIVVHPLAEMPPICVRTGTAGFKSVKQKLEWRPAWVYLGLLGGVLPLLVLSLILTRRRTLSPWLSEEAYARRRRFLNLAWGGALLGLAMIVLCITLAAGFHDSLPIGLRDGTYATLAIGGTIGILAGILVGNFSSPILKAKLIHEHYSLMAGASEEFLQYLEEFPNELPK